MRRISELSEHEVDMLASVHRLYASLEAVVGGQDADVNDFNRFDHFDNPFADDIFPPVFESEASDSGEDYEATTKKQADERAQRRQRRADAGLSDVEPSTESGSSSSEKDERQPTHKHRKSAKGQRSSGKAHAHSPHSNVQDTAGTAASSATNKGGHIPPAVLERFKSFGNAMHKEAQELATLSGYTLATVMQATGLSATSTRKINIANAYKSYYTDLVHDETDKAGEPSMYTAVIMQYAPNCHPPQGNRPGTSATLHIANGKSSMAMTRQRFKKSLTM